MMRGGSQYIRNSHQPASVYLELFLMYNPTLVTTKMVDNHVTKRAAL